MEDKLTEFIDYMKVIKNCTDSTLSDYRKDIEQYLEAKSIKSLSQVTKQSIISFLGILSDDGRSATTRNRKLSAIRSFCKYLHTERHLRSNPAIDIPYAKTDKRLPITFTVNEIKNVINSAESLRDAVILEILYGTGVRVQELVDMKIEHINFDGDGRIKVFGKESKERVVPMSKSAKTVLLEYLATREEISNYVFPSPENPAVSLTTRTIGNIVDKYAKENGLKMSPHKFRHSVATHLYSRGMDIRQVQVLLGHANINTTTIYTQVAPDDMISQFHSSHPLG